MYVSKIDKEFIKNYGNDRDIRFILKVDIEYPKELHDLHSYFPFLTGKMKINKHKKLVCTLCDKKKCCPNKKLKKCIRAWFKTKKSTQSNCILLKSMT